MRLWPHLHHTFYCTIFLGLCFNKIIANSIIKADLCSFLYFVCTQVKYIIQDQCSVCIRLSFHSVRVQQNPESYIQIPILVKAEGCQEGAYNSFLFILFDVILHYLSAQGTNRKKNHGTKKKPSKTGFMFISCGNA